MRKSKHYVKYMLALAMALIGSVSAVSADNDLRLADITIAKKNYVVGETIGITLSLENVGSSTVNSFVVDFAINDVKVAEKRFEQVVISGRSVSVDTEIDHNLNEQTLGAELRATVSKVNDSADENAENNSMSEEINVYQYLFDRNVVIEEGTGTWCGWCVRGIVAMKDMYSAHPYDFIGIAVHNKDNLTVSEYDSNLGIISYPACNVNRELKRMDVSSDNFESYYQYSKLQAALGDVYSTASVSEDNTTLSVNTEAEFCYTGEDSYNIAYVLVEDHVEGYKQKNYYSGGNYGEMGGFEDLPKEVEIELNDVARGIYPNYEGTTFTTNQTTGEVITYSHEITIPEQVQHKSNLSLITLLIDTTRGYIVNAHKTALNLSDDPDQPGGEDPDQPGGEDPDQPGGEDPDQPGGGEYQYIDLGLSVMWSTRNMDTAENGFAQVESEEMCGGYYGWADPTGLLTVADDAMYPQGELPTEISGTEYDIARLKWGNGWRMPTHEEFVELYENCTTESVELNGVKGMRFTSVKNGNSIFFPYNGSRYEADVWSVGEYGSYWSGTLYDQEMDGIYFAYELDFDDWGVNINCVGYRYEGMAIRPVLNPESGINRLDLDNTYPSTRFYNLDGMEVKRPTVGIYIKKEITKEGNIKTTKVLIK